jgi:hypothetical protein
MSWSLVCLRREGGLMEEIRPDNVTWLHPERSTRTVQHGHDAHCNSRKSLNGKAVEWLDKVSEDWYRR